MLTTVPTNTFILTSQYVGGEARKTAVGRRTSSWEKPSPGLRSLLDGSRLHLNDGDSRGKVQNVRGNSSAVHSENSRAKVQIVQGDSSEYFYDSFVTFFASVRATRSLF